MVNDFEERKRRIQSNKISRISHLLYGWLLFYIAHVRTGAEQGVAECTTNINYFLLHGYSSQTCWFKCPTCGVVLNACVYPVTISKGSRQSLFKNRQLAIWLRCFLRVDGYAKRIWIHVRKLPILQFPYTTQEQVIPDCYLCKLSCRVTVETYGT